MLRRKSGQLNGPLGILLYSWSLPIG